MNTYIIAVRENSVLNIKKFVAQSEKGAEEKLYQYLYNKYEDLEGDTLDEIRDQLWDNDVEIEERFHDIDEFL